MAVELQKGDCMIAFHFVHDEGLYVERVGVSGAPILISGGFEKTHGGKIPGGEGSVKVAYVVLVVCLIGGTDIRDGGRRQVVRVGGLLVILKRLVVRDVVA